MRVTKDFLGGVLFVCLGLGTMVAASNYPLGTAMRMGPGYFPLLIGVLITLLGFILAVRGAIRWSSAEQVSDLAPRPLFFTLAAILVFALLIESWGLIAAISALVLIARLSRIEGSTFELIASLLVLNMIAVLVFILGLKIPLQVSPW